MTGVRSWCCPYLRGPFRAAKGADRRRACAPRRRRARRARRPGPRARSSRRRARASPRRRLASRPSAGRPRRGCGGRRRGRRARRSAAGRSAAATSVPARAAADEHDASRRARRPRPRPATPRAGRRPRRRASCARSSARAPRAPSASACARRSGWRSQTVTSRPSSTSSRASISPIVPPPRTRDVGARRSPARATACTARRSGSAIAAPAGSSPSGTACSAACGRRDQLGERRRAPSVIARQSCGRPARHGAHAPHGDRVADEHALAGVRAHAGRLVAEARRVGAEDRVAVAQHLHVGPARRRRLDARRAPRPRGSGRLLDAQVVRAVEDRGAHHGQHERLDRVAGARAARAPRRCPRAARRCVTSGSGSTRPRRDAASNAARMSRRAGRVATRTTSISRAVQRAAVEVERLARVGRRVEAQRAAGRDAPRTPSAIAAGCGVQTMRDVDELVAVALGAQRERALQALGPRLAHPHGVDRAGVRGGDRQQPARARRRRRAGCRPRAARSGRTRAGRTPAARRTWRARCRGRRAAAARRRGRPGRGRARRSRPGRRRGRAELLAQRLVAAAAAPALAARRVVVDDDAVARRDAASRPRRPPRPRPHSSWPSTAGTLRATQLSRTSEPQTPQASTRQTTSPAPARGLGVAPRCGPRATPTERATLMPRRAAPRRSRPSAARRRRAR